MRNCETQYYQQFDGADVEENNHENVMVHIVPENKCELNTWMHPPVEVLVVTVHDC